MHLQTGVVMQLDIKWFNRGVREPVGESAQRGDKIKLLSVFKKTKPNSQRTESVPKETAIFERTVEDASAPYIRITISKQDKLLLVGGGGDFCPSIYYCVAPQKAMDCS